MLKVGVGSRTVGGEGGVERRMGGGEGGDRENDGWW